MLLPDIGREDKDEKGTPGVPGKEAAVLGGWGSKRTLASRWPAPPNYGEVIWGPLIIRTRFGGKSYYKMLYRKQYW